MLILKKNLLIMPPGQILPSALWWVDGAGSLQLRCGMEELILPQLCPAPPSNIHAAMALLPTLLQPQQRAHPSS